MKLARISKVGLMLTVLGLLIFFGYAIWAKSIRTTVMDIPLPMKAETIAKEFNVDYDALYTMWVAFDRSISREASHCLLGGRKSELDENLDCKSTAPLLNFSWELSRDGKSGGTGSSADTGSSSTTRDSMDVSIVSFAAQKKHRYSVTLKFGQDASTLKMPPPRVRIELDIFNREDFIFAGAAFDSLGFLLCAVGVVMVLVPVLRAKFNQSKLPPNLHTS